MACLDETSITLFLEQQLGHDRARSLEQHIDDCPACRHLLAELTRRRTIAEGSGPVRRAEGVATSTSRVPGNLIDRYLVLRPIGSGGMGTVYAAYDPVLDRKVALKLLHRGAEDHRLRLIREAQAMARVSSPNVVAVHDAGVFDDQVYVSMELVAGGTLRTWLKQSPRTWRDITRVFSAAAQGLAAAHAGGLVHRDFKPDNVLIDGERVRVADFGLAAPLGELLRDHELPADSGVSALDQPLTITGAMVGTPAYMAPEQFAGRSADARTDQFSFCVALYEALCGSRPFAGGTLEELRGEVMRGAVRPLTAGPSWLRAAVTRGLARDPDHRFPTMMALIQQLERGRRRPRQWLVAGLTVTAIAAVGLGAHAATDQPDPCAGASIPPSVAYDGAAIRRAFIATRAGSESIAARAIDEIERFRSRAGVLKLQACRASRVASTESPELFDLRMSCVGRAADQVNAVARALAQPDMTEQLIDNSVTALSQAGDLGACNGPRDGLEAAREPADPVLRAHAATLRARVQTARIDKEAGRYPAAAAAATEVAREAGRAGLRELEAHARLLAGVAHTYAADFVPAREQYKQALLAAEAAGAHALRARIYLVLALSDHKFDRNDDAERWIAQARGVADQLGTEELKLEVRYSEAQLHTWNKDFAKAVEALRPVTEETERLLGVTPTTLNRLEMYGLTLWNLDKLEQGDEVLRRVIAMTEELVGDQHPMLVRPLLATGAIATELGRPEDALVDLRRAYAIAERVVGSNSGLFAAAAGATAIALNKQNKVDEALEYLDRAIRGYATATGGDTTAFMRLRGMRAEILLNADRAEEALAEFREVTKVMRERKGVDSLEFASALHDEGVALQRLRQFDEAQRAYEGAASIIDRRPEANSLIRFDVTKGLGSNHLEAGRPARAIPYLARAIEIRNSRATSDPTEVADAQYFLGRAFLERGHREDRRRAFDLLLASRSTMEQLKHLNNNAHHLKLVDELLAKYGVKPATAGKPTARAAHRP
ncbi:MAG: protein kinase [Kofleriaceae bacterium]